MNLRKRVISSVIFLFLLGLFLASLVTVSADQSLDFKVYTLDIRYLEASKKMIAAKDPSVMPAYEKLISEADKALTVPPQSVVEKTLTPPSGDKHDYLSLAPYWWPDPAKPNGLPYIRKDGQTNSNSKNNASDAVRKGVFISTVDTLSVAYYFSGNRAYAERAALLIRTWFLDPKTRMNPNLNYGQAIPGICDGRGIGIIDFSDIYKTIDDLGLLQSAGVFSKSEQKKLVNWFKEYFKWLQTSPCGLEEKVWHNNHGTWYDVQVVALAFFLKDQATAKSTLFNATHTRLASQITMDGKQFAELERTRPWHYSTVNLNGLMLLGRYAEQVSLPLFTSLYTPTDFWNFDQDQRTLRKAIDYLAYYLDKPSEWPYQDLDNADSRNNKMLPILLQAERAYGGGTYANLLKFMPPSSMTSRDRLLWPVLPK